MVLAGLNLPNGPAYANFTEELFHTDQFQVLIKLHRENNQDSYSHFQIFSELCQLYDHPLGRVGHRLGQCHALNFKV